MPVAPASESVWQLAQPAAPRKTSLPAPGRPLARLARRSSGVVSAGGVVGRLRLRRRLVGLRLLFAEVAVHEHRGDLRDEEDTTDRDEESEPLARESRARARNDERADEREDDEEGGDDQEARLVPRQRQQHEPDATTVLGDEIRLLLERRHRQAEVLELRPVELRLSPSRRTRRSPDRSRRCGSRAPCPGRSSRPAARSRARRRRPGTCCGRRSGR